MAIYDINRIELAASYSGKVIVPDNGIKSTCAEIYTLYDAFVTGGYATKTQIATVNDLPMYRYDFSAVNKWASGADNLEDTSGNKLYTKLQALLFSGIHGDEKGAVLYQYEFLKKCCYDADYCRFLSLFDFHVVPIGNPYGYNANTRNNANDINMNRIDQSSGTTEAQALMAEIDRQSYDIFVDCHNTNTDQTDSHNVTGCMSFANDTPNATMVKCYERYLKANMQVERALHEYLKMEDDNNLQHFMPWQGTNSQTFRNYGFTHTSNNNTVGAPISACFEMSRCCYSFSASTTQWNTKSLTVGNTSLHATLSEFFDAVFEGFFN